MIIVSKVVAVVEIVEGCGELVGKVLVIVVVETVGPSYIHLTSVSFSRLIILSVS